MDWVDVSQYLVDVVPALPQIQVGEGGRGRLKNMDWVDVSQYLVDVVPALPQLQVGEGGRGRLKNMDWVDVVPALPQIQVGGGGREGPPEEHGLGGRSAGPTTDPGW